MDILKTLQALNACHGPAGDEAQVAAKLRELAAPYVDECRVDTLGNLICRKKGSGPRVMFAAHMDSIGFIVTHIDEKGFLRFGKLGGLSAPDLLGTPIRFKNGVRGVVALEGKVEAKNSKLDDLYIDIGAADRAQAKAMVQIGDTAVYDTPAFRTGGRIFSPYLDDRIACVVLLMAMERLVKRLLATRLMPLMVIMEKTTMVAPPTTQLGMVESTEASLGQKAATTSVRPPAPMT